MDVSAEADGKRRREEGRGGDEWVKVVCRAARATRRGLASPGQGERQRGKKKRIKATVEDKIIIAR